MAMMLANFLVTTFRDPGTPTAYKLEVGLHQGGTLIALERRIYRTFSGLAR